MCAVFFLLFSFGLYFIFSLSFGEFSYDTSSRFLSFFWTVFAWSYPSVNVFPLQTKWKSSSRWSFPPILGSQLRTRQNNFHLLLDTFQNHPNESVCGENLISNSWIFAHGNHFPWILRCLCSFQFCFDLAILSIRHMW